MHRTLTSKNVFAGQGISGSWVSKTWPFCELNLPGIMMGRDPFRQFRVTDNFWQHGEGKPFF